MYLFRIKGDRTRQNKNSGLQSCVVVAVLVLINLKHSYQGMVPYACNYNTLMAETENCQEVQNSLG